VKPLPLQVGYGDISPTKDGSKLFFVFYIMFGLFIFAAAIGFVFERMKATAFNESKIEHYLCETSFLFSPQFWKLFFMGP